jgi:hypothetical protein
MMREIDVGNLGMLVSLVAEIGQTGVARKGVKPIRPKAQAPRIRWLLNPTASNAPRHVRTSSELKRITQGLESQQLLPRHQSIMDPSSTCYTIVHDDLADSPSSQDLRNALQKGSDEVKLETMRRIIVSTLNGQGHVGPLRNALYLSLTSISRRF